MKSLTKNKRMKSKEKSKNIKESKTRKKTKERTEITNKKRTHIFVKRFAESTKRTKNRNNLNTV